ncbi:MAG: heparinase II/III family protein, partial [Calditrichia bacterium]|nr:heparinase II/III family protein [Calditrichia bacterium]
LQYLSQFSVYQENCFGHSLFNNPRLERMVNWLLDNYKGSGSFAQFDDAYDLNKFFLPLIIHLTPSGSKWEEALNQLPSHNSYQSNMIEALCIYRKKPLTQYQYQPAFAGAFYPDLGQYIFHDQTPVPDFFFSLNGENERWFADVHEHIDPLSFELSAYGEDFIVEGGYGKSTSDKNRHYFISPLANNGVLIDGKGVNPNPVNGDPLEAKLQYAFTTSNFGCAVLSHRISDVDITRFVFYHPQAQLIIYDRFEGEKEHNYSIHLNHTGNLMEISDNQFHIQKQTADLDVLMLKNPDEKWQLKRSRGLATGNGIYEHGVIDIESEKKITAEIATIYLPKPVNANSLTTEIPLTKG